MFVKLIDGLSDLPSISRDELNDIVLGFVEPTTGLMAHSAV